MRLARSPENSMVSEWCVDWRRERNNSMSNIVLGRLRAAKSIQFQGTMQTTRFTYPRGSVGSGNIFCYWVISTVELKLFGTDLHNLGMIYCGRWSDIVRIDCLVIMLSILSFVSPFLASSGCEIALWEYLLFNPIITCRSHLCLPTNQSFSFFGHKIEHKNGQRECCPPN